MIRVNASLLGISEIRRCMINEHVIYYCSDSSVCHCNGIGILLRGIDRYDKSFESILDRILLVQSKISPRNVNVT